MSWQSYVDDQLLATKTVTAAAIAGHDGNLWATRCTTTTSSTTTTSTSTGFPATAEEVRKVLGSMGDTQGLAMAGVTIGGVRCPQLQGFLFSCLQYLFPRYMYLSGDEKVIRARKKTAGLHIMKTVQAVIIAVYDEPIVPEQCANTTEKLGDYLISVGY